MLVSDSLGPAPASKGDLIHRQLHIISYSKVNSFIKWLAAEV